MKVYKASFISTWVEFLHCREGEQDSEIGDLYI
jgi:hypothetical protein